VLGRSKFQEGETFAVLDRVRRILAIFFASAGLRVDLGLLIRSAGGALGAAGAARRQRLEVRRCLPRWLVRRSADAGAPGPSAPGSTPGAVEIVVATVGLSLGILNGSSYTVIVLMAMATSVAAPPLLRLALRDWQGSEEEQARLERERMLRSNVLVRASRVLLPSHGGPN
jgi:Kef-type K+ transport system membrane component KefB